VVGWGGKLEIFRRSDKKYNSSLIPAATPKKYYNFFKNKKNKKSPERKMQRLSELKATNSQNYINFF
jgi:hypothetical protein